MKSKVILPDTVFLTFYFEEVIVPSLKLVPASYTVTVPSMHMPHMQVKFCSQNLISYNPQPPLVVRPFCIKTVRPLPVSAEQAVLR